MKHRSRARTENALLRSNHLDEQITWIGVEVPPISFGELVHSSESRLLSLANTLDLSPGGEDSQISLLNKVFRQLGVSCTNSTCFSLLIHWVTLCTLTDPVQRRSFEDQRPAHTNYNKPLMTPTEAPLYIFLAYLTMFVYSSVVL